MSEIELPQLPVGWEWVPVADLGAIEDGAITDGPFGSKLKTEHYTQSGPRVIRLQNIGSGYFVDERAHISQAHFETLRKHEAHAGDIVIAALGETLPRACLVPDDLGPAVVKADCPRFRPHPVLNTQYLVYALNSPPVRSQARAMLHGLGRPRLNLGEVKSLRLPLPPRAEQDRIVGEIGRHAAHLRDGTARFGVALQELDAYEVASYADAFSGERLGVDAAAWEKYALVDVTEKITSGSRDWKPYYGKGTGVFVMAQNVRPRSLDLSSVFHVDPPESDTARTRSAIKRDDVLITIVGAGTGTVARVPKELDDHWVCQSVALIRPTPPLSGAFLELFLNAPGAGRTQIEQRIYGQGRPHLSFDDLRSIEIPVPDPAVQRDLVTKLARRLAAATTLRRAISEASHDHDEAQRALLLRACLGNLAEQSPADEPAAVLLGQIAVEREQRKRKTMGAKRHRRKVKAT